MVRSSRESASGLRQGLERLGDVGNGDFVAGFKTGLVNGTVVRKPVYVGATLSTALAEPWRSGKTRTSLSARVQIVWLLPIVS